MTFRLVRSYSLRRKPTIFSDIISSRVNEYEIDYHRGLEDTIIDILNDTLQQETADNYVQLIINSVQLDSPIILNRYYCKRSEVDVTAIINEIERVNQSKKGLLLNNTLQVTVYTIARPSGNGIVSLKKVVKSNIKTI